MEDFWGTWGPVSSVVMALGFASMCSAVLLCFKRYKKNLEEYEESPFNPANEAEI